MPSLFPGKESKLVLSAMECSMWLVSQFSPSSLLMSVESSLLGRPDGGKELDGTGCCCVSFCGDMGVLAWLQSLL